jgi:uncharacterized membrane protein (UPF0127 family)
MRTVRVIHEPSGKTLAPRARVAESAFRRGLGLLACRVLKPGEALWLLPCAGIHTFGMAYALDVLLLDQDLRVLAVAQGLQPWRLLYRPGLRAHSVLELPAASLAGLDLRPGQRLRVEPVL